jgi:hypothetical protein
VLNIVRKKGEKSTPQTKQKKYFLKGFEARNQTGPKDVKPLVLVWDLGGV